MSTTTTSSIGWRIFIILSVAMLLTAHTSAQNDANGKVYRVGVGVSPPRVTDAPNPEYTREARTARYQGICILRLVVGEDGRPRDVTVTRRLGYGLDEKAVEAVKQWKFKPAMKDGKPVAVQINVEVTFHLYDDPSSIPKSVAKPVHYEKSIWFTKEKLEQIHELWKQEHTAEQLADLRTKCGPYVGTKLDDLESKRGPLPPHECASVLGWMRDLRVEALYVTQDSTQ